MKRFSSLLYAFKYGFRTLVLTVVLLCLSVVGWRIWLNLAYQPHIYTSIAKVPAHQVAIVFGAGIRNNRPSAALADRIEAAAALYHAGKVHKLLMSGDNRFIAVEQKSPG